MKKIYYKNEQQRGELEKKYPDVKAAWISMEGTTGLSDMLPMVCVDENGAERCEVGEKYIKDLKGE